MRAAVTLERLISAHGPMVGSRKRHLSAPRVRFGEGCSTTVSSRAPATRAAGTLQYMVCVHRPDVGSWSPRWSYLVLLFKARRGPLASVCLYVQPNNGTPGIGSRTRATMANKWIA